MMFTMNKETRLNLRITEELRGDIETLAAYHGLAMSSYAHSLLVKSVRHAKEEHPEAFGIESPRHVAPVVATIGSPAAERREAQRMIDEAQLKTTGIPLAKTGSAITAAKINTKTNRRTG